MAEILILKLKKKLRKTRMPLSALKLLADIIKKMNQYKPISVVPVAAEVATQLVAVAEILQMHTSTAPAQIPSCGLI